LGPRQGAGAWAKYLLVESLRRISVPAKPPVVPNLHNPPITYLGGFVISARSANDEDGSIVTSAHRVEGV
jgi:hypothetical protein